MRLLFWILLAILVTCALSQGTNESTVKSTPTIPQTVSLKSSQSSSTKTSKTPTKPSKISTTTTPAPKPTPAPGSSFHAGAFFGGIFFGMILMVGLILVYRVWLKRRMDNPGMRAY
ncbi:hypothetical protein L596_007029 [Steinernema carpocapsae]|uniref:Uncharacterized protein n=1 Tax=Steinernema carpocapsae TaxID=34508 RepID=A0A4U5P803_STECR|nr:hypothetical protein L596_007029 [Steinernema carpocapsae]